MKKIVSSLIAGLMAVSLVMMGCSNDSSSDNTALMLLVSSSGSGSGSSGGTVAAGGAVKALADAKTGETVDLSEYKLSDKIALTVDKAITVKNAKLNGGYITVSEEATLDNVDGGTIVLVGNGKNATLKDCDAKNVIVKEAELKEADLSRVVQHFTLKINGGVVEKIINNSLYLIIETTKTTIKKLITEQNLVIKSTDDSKIELIGAREPITLAGKLVIEKAVTESIVKVASKTVSIQKGMVEIVADDSEYAEDNLNIEAIKAAVGELTDSECEALYKTLTALEKEAEEMESKIQAAEEEAKKALEEYEKEQEKTVVTVYFVDEGKVSPEQKVPLAEVEKYLEGMTADMPDYVEIGFFSDKACTKPVEVKNIKAGDTIYIQVLISGGVVTVYFVDEGKVSPEQKVPLAELEKILKSMTEGMQEGVEIGLFSDEACTKPVDVKDIKDGDTIYIKVSGLPDLPDEPYVIVNGENVPLYTMIADLEDGQSFYINGEVNMGNENGWLPMMGNVFTFTYDENMKAWGSKTGSVKVNMTRDEAAENPYADGVKVVVWDKGENISWADGAISLDGLVQGKSYALVMTNSTQANNTDGKGKHVELYEVVMNGSMGE